MAHLVLSRIYKIKRGGIRGGWPRLSETTSEDGWDPPASMATVGGPVALNM